MSGIKGKTSNKRARVQKAVEYDNENAPYSTSSTKGKQDKFTLEDIKTNLKCSNETQKKFVNSIKDNEITICNGPAGTGKTYVACAQALNDLKSGRYKNIVIVKSVIPIKDEEIGFLKGDLKEKMEPFLFSFVHNFQKICGEELTEFLLEKGYIKNMPIAYMRGINIDNAIIIIDEAQNLTSKKILTILTRLGKNSKMIFMGDSNQIDMKNPNTSGLERMLNDFDGIEGFGTVNFEEKDCVRHEVVKSVLNRVKELPNKQDYL